MGSLPNSQLFQFHKVQLTLCQIVAYLLLTLFQFHKVQLTLLMTRQPLLVQSSFNSIRYN